MFCLKAQLKIPVDVTYPTVFQAHIHLFIKKITRFDWYRFIIEQCYQVVSRIAGILKESCNAISPYTRHSVQLFIWVLWGVHPSTFSHQYSQQFSTKELLDVCLGITKNTVQFDDVFVQYITPFRDLHRNNIRHLHLEHFAYSTN